MKQIIIVLALTVATLSASAQTSLSDIVRAEARRQDAGETKIVPQEYRCFQPSIVVLAINTLDWQRERIAELEAKCGDRCK